jgi:hypothetical protein
MHGSGSRSSGGAGSGCISSCGGGCTMFHFTHCPRTGGSPPRPPPPSAIRSDVHTLTGSPRTARTYDASQAQRGMKSARRSASCPLRASAISCHRRGLLLVPVPPSGVVLEASSRTTPVERYLARVRELMRNECWNVRVCVCVCERVHVRACACAQVKVHVVQTLGALQTLGAQHLPSAQCTKRTLRVSPLRATSTGRATEATPHLR